MILGIGHILLSYTTAFLSHFPLPPNLWNSDFLGQYMKKGGLLSGWPGPEVRLAKAKHTIHSSLLQLVSEWTRDQ